MYSNSNYYRLIFYHLIIMYTNNKNILWKETYKRQHKVFIITKVFEALKDNNQTKAIISIQTDVLTIDIQQNADENVVDFSTRVWMFILSGAF